MNQKTPRPANSGDTKLSEVAVDEAIPLIQGSAPQDNALVTVETAFKALTEIARRQNYFLRSDDIVTWDGAQLRFDGDTPTATNVFMEFFATEGSVNPAFQLKMQGSITANDATHFLNMPLADGDLLYLELDSALLVDQGALFTVGNGVTGGSGATGLRLLKQPITTAMPKIQLSITNGGSLFYIPLALRRGTDILWIPHGIRWPIATTSKLGAVIVEGLQAYPELFAKNQTELTNAVTTLSGAGGGVILITAPFNLSVNVNLGSNIKILSRGVGKNAITLLNGSGFTMVNNCELSNLILICQSAFTGNMITIGGDKNILTDCKLDLTATTNVATNRGVNVNGNWNRLYNCAIAGVTGALLRIGVNFVTGDNNAAVDTTWT